MNILKKKDDGAKTTGYDTGRTRFNEQNLAIDLVKQLSLAGYNCTSFMGTSLCPEKTPMDRDADALFISLHSTLTILSEYGMDR